MHVYTNFDKLEINKNEHILNLNICIYIFFHLHYLIIIQVFNLTDGFFFQLIDEKIYTMEYVKN